MDFEGEIEQIFDSFQYRDFYEPEFLQVMLHVPMLSYRLIILYAWGMKS